MRKLLIVALGALTLGWGSSRARPWTIETVDSSGQAGQYVSLAIDALGGLHLCYYDSLNRDLRYARRTGAVWSYGAIDTTGDVGRYCAIAVGADNLPRVSYFDSTNRSLKYAAFDGTNWAAEAADAGPGVGQYTSITLNGTNPCISYHNQATQDLKYATKAASWTLTTVDSTGAVGRYTSVAFGGDNKPRISYYFDTLKQLRFARMQGSNWVSEVPDAAVNSGSYSSLVLDGNDPIIAYLDSAGGKIKRAAKTTSWAIDTVDNSGAAGGFVSLAIDNSGNPMVSYFDRANGDLKFASHSGAAWAPETVDTSGTVGLYTSCLVGSDSTVYIAYYDQTRGRLKLATTSDTIPPGPPVNLAANGATPSPWSNYPRFGLNWTNPPDRSGIIGSRYKLGSAPAANDDTTGSLKGLPPDSAFATAGGGQALYLWLVDGAGNTSYQNRATVLLRYDSTPPAGSIGSSPAYSATAGFAVSWSAGADSGGSGLSGRYTVRVRDGSGPWNTWLSDTAAVSGAYTGGDGHRYYFEAAARDSAGNVEAFSAAPECSTLVNITVPAVTAMAVAPDTVGPAGFTVLTGRIADNLKVTGAEYFIDSIGADGSGMAVTPVDSFGAAAVDVFDTVFTSALASGPHRIYLHGADNAGQWGPCDSASFYKAAPYEEPSGAFLPENMVYVWPNPARGSQVHFHYYVSSDAAVTADVFNLEGRRIAHLTGRGEGGRPPHQPSSNAVVWDIPGVASDVYLLRLTATSDASGEQKTVTKKFAIVR